MSLQTALSGLNAAQTGIDTISNDLANANTTAFKNQTALFSDMYPEDETDVPGIGASTEAISSDFSQGISMATGNALDAAIQGNGFFIVGANGQQQYTRDGAFELNTQGQLVTSTGADVLGYATAGGNVSATLSPITINTGAIPAVPTSTLGLPVSLNTGDALLPAGTVPVPGNPATYDEATSVVTYDSLGNANTVNLYFSQVAPATAGGTPSWQVYAQPVTSAGTATGAPALLTTLTFNPNGTLAAGGAPTLNVNWANGSANSAIAFNFGGTTLGAQTFAVGTPTNNGSAAGSFSGAAITSTGAVQATYSNGQTVTFGTLGLANFINQEGLQPVSGNLYAATPTSGQPAVNVPGSGQSGLLQSGYLEQSNVSTSTSLVDLIQYQQAYEANATEIQTEQQNFTKLSQI